MTYLNRKIINRKLKITFLWGDKVVGQIRNKLISLGDDTFWSQEVIFHSVKTAVNKISFQLGGMEVKRTLSYPIFINSKTKLVLNGEIQIAGFTLVLE